MMSLVSQIKDMIYQHPMIVLSRKIGRTRDDLYKVRCEKGWYSDFSMSVVQYLSQRIQEDGRDLRGSGASQKGLYCLLW